MADGALLGGLPPVRRARGFHLYTHQGRRYLDLFQDDGAAILGHRPPGAVREMKDALSRGLAAGLPSVYERRLDKEVRRLLPGCAAVLAYPGAEAALRAVSLFLGRPLGLADVRDPALCPEAADLAWWRPFLPGQGAPDSAVLLPVLPVAGTRGPLAVCFPSAPPAEASPARPVPGYLLAAMLRGLADLSAAVRDERVSGAVDGAIAGSRAWRRRGPYVTALFEPSRYPAVFRAFLDAGVLLSPAFPGPSILPAEATEGERAALARLFGSTPGG
jgi:hypothetical protein